MPFERKRADKEERAEFRKDLAESGFKDAFPILYQSAGVPAQGWLNLSLPKVVRDDVYANNWPEVVSLMKYPTWQNRRDNTEKYDDWRDAWKVLMAECVKDMTEVTRTDVLWIP
jgi:hypothetical protein